MTAHQTILTLLAAFSLMLTAMPAALAGGKSGPGVGQTSNPLNANNAVGSRRDRRGQPQHVITPPPKDTRPIRGVQVRCDGHKCGPYNPFQEHGNRRAQVRDHRSR